MDRRAPGCFRNVLVTGVSRLIWRAPAEHFDTRVELQGSMYAEGRRSLHRPTQWRTALCARPSAGWLRVGCRLSESSGSALPHHSTVIMEAHRYLRKIKPHPHTTYQLDSTRGDSDCSRALLQIRRILLSRTALRAIREEMRRTRGASILLTETHPADAECELAWASIAPVCTEIRFCNIGDEGRRVQVVM